MKRFVFITFMLLAVNSMKGQKNVKTMGFQIKPILPFHLIDKNDFNGFKNEIAYSNKQFPGYAAGMILRNGLTDKWSFESGINFVKRNYNFTIYDPVYEYRDSTNYSIIGYEIPFSALIFVQLSEKWFMNNSLGFSCDIFPSNVGITQGSFVLTSYRKYWVQPSLLANVGWEFRSKKSGYFYFGGSFHRPFMLTYGTQITYTRPVEHFDLQVPLSGAYLTVDFRYFFHEEARVKKDKKQEGKKPVKDREYFEKFKRENSKVN